MWAKEYSVETGAQPEQIWQLWTDVAGWPAWNGDIERIELIGPFAVGSRILMTPIGEERSSFVSRSSRARALRRRGRSGRNRGQNDTSSPANRSRPRVKDLRPLVRTNDLGETFSGARSTV